VNLEPDASGAEGKIAFEYVSASDISDWDDGNGGPYGYNPPVNRDKVRIKHNDITIGIFYEAHTKEELQGQVRDYLDWLKSQGII
jgi:hypothetical protein